MPSVSLTVSEPRPAGRELLIVVESISLNPVDPLYAAHPLASTGRTVGSDFTGRMVQLGSQVSAFAGFERSARVADFLQGACSVNEWSDAFADCVVVFWDLVWRTYFCRRGCGCEPRCFDRYRMELMAPFVYDREAALKENPTWRQSRTAREDRIETINVFIYSASTSVVLYAAQSARTGTII
jgi:hypothetical protein